MKLQFAMPMFNIPPVRLITMSVLQGSKIVHKICAVQSLMIVPRVLTYSIFLHCPIQKPPKNAVGLVNAASFHTGTANSRIGNDTLETSALCLHMIRLA